MKNIRKYRYCFDALVREANGEIYPIQATTTTQDIFEVEKFIIDSAEKDNEVATPIEILQLTVMPVYQFRDPNLSIH